MGDERIDHDNNNNNNNNKNNNEGFITCFRLKNGILHVYI